ncbi:glycosyltransferase family 4 protein [Pseudogracilibacillus auburnensis]|uniref:Glycosyltransferase involved in cell wall biosynthesis n=1 Tax=Pseudogracilibacillus auburnensis TaxID=1494959 RepID=A0A2V3VVF0_9BACI|nr:glycosyltransferase family 4 protein [Pseudogracilibacillus auburnensis]PXW85952.1 glycosyltransferase involved in cell wall biosynthesis [Pseudogracilibacillus auburnensis]
MSKKKIWIFNHYATNMFFNKGGRHYWFAENLSINGYEPTIFCANIRHNTDDVIDCHNNKYSRKILNDIPFVFVKTTKSIGNGIDRVKNMSIFFFNLLSIANKYVKIYGKPDFILSSSVHPLTMVAGIRIAKKLGVPCICEIRDLWPEAIFAFKKAKEKSLLGKVLLAGERWIYKNADALIFTKEGDTDYIIEKKWDIKQGGDIDLKKCYYINNGVDLKSFNELSIQNTIEDEDLVFDKFNVIYVGAIRPVNNVGNILDAATILKDEKEIQFLIYGDGTEKEMLEKRVAEKNLTNVKMKGFVNKKFIPYILSKSSINILNYSQTQYNWKRGNSSNKLFEYMASGKPIISTVKMGYSIINRYNCGIELEESTPKELANAILKIKGISKKQYMALGQSAREGAEDFDFKKLTKKLIDVLETVDRKKT